MPGKIIKWKCMFCGSVYRNFDDAAECEKKGPAPIYPIGTMFGNNNQGSIYKDVVCVVAENHIFSYHYNDGGMWAFRDNGCGDTFGEKKCGGGFLELNERDSYINRDMPAFNRAVAWLKSQGIKPMIWDGEKAVPYEEQEEK